MFAPRWVLGPGDEVARLLGPDPEPQPRAEARSAPRQKVSGVTGTYQHRMEIRVRDVAPWGLGIETLQRLPFLTAGALRLQVAEESFDWIAEMRWCRVARIEHLGEDSRPVFAAGFRVERGSATPDRELLAALQRDSGWAGAWRPGPVRPASGET